MIAEKSSEELEQRIHELEEALASQGRLLEASREKTETYKRTCENLFALFESMDDCLLVCDSGGKPVLFNRAYRKLIDKAFGIEMEPGLQPHKLLTDKGEVAYWENLHKRVLGGDKFTIEYTLDFRKGDLRHFEIRFAPIFEDKHVIGFTEYARDVTQQRVSDESLLNEKALFEQLFESSQVAIVMSDRGNIVQRVNRAFSLLFGYTQEEACGRPVADLLVPEEDREEAERQIKRLWNGEVRELEAIRRRKDGSQVHISMAVSPILIHDKWVGNYAMYQDITERKHAEEELRSSEEKFRRLAEHSPFGLSIMRENGEFEYLNPRFTEMLGYSLSDIPDKPTWFEKAYPDPTAREKVIPLWKKDVEDVKSGKTSERVLTVRCKDGRDKIIHFRHVEMRDHKHYTTYEDVTERKRLETKLRQAQKMEAIGTLAGGIAHDFNNILSAVIGYSELALDETPIGSSIQNDLKNVLEAGERARALVNQILTFSRQREQELKPIQIMPIVKETLKLLRASLPSTIEIQQDIQSDALIMGDPTQIHQVLMNLCTNAGYAMDEKGGILHLSLVPVDLNKDFTSRHPDLNPGPYLKLIVRDTGSGIPPELMDRIFDPFFTTKGEGEGTGMGLSVVHGIVKTHGGAITADSEPGKGTTFNVYLPVFDVGVTPAEQSKRTLKAGSERILFIDDEEFQVDLGKQMLERLGYRVVTRRSSPEALELFRENPYDFDLVITDMTMPIMTGDVLAKELIALRPEIPIILCTGFSNRISEEKALDLGIRAFVLKPIVMHEMADTVRRVLDGL